MLAVTFVPYAKPEGLGRAMSAGAGALDAVVATVVFGAVATAVGWREGIIVGAAALLVGGAVSWLSVRKLGGLTGDGYGAACVLAETAALAALTVR